MTPAKIKRIALEFRKGLLGKRESDLMCLAVCRPLEGWLGFLGVDCKVVEGEFLGAHHCWLDLGDGNILDPTIDQFNSSFVKLPKVYLGPPMPQHKADK